MTDLFRIGIVGVGRIARTYFPVLERMKNVRVSFLCDIFPEPMEGAVRDFPELLGGARRCANTDEVLGVEQGRETVDAVLISTPLSTHFMLSARVLQRGVRVLVEKPGVASLEELKALYALAEENGTTFQTLYHFAYAPEVIRFASLRSQIEPRMGALRGFSCDFQDPAVSGNLLTISPRNQGGSFLSSGVNALSVLDCVCGLESLRPISRILRQIPELRDLNEERVPLAVDTASCTDYSAPARGLSGTIRTDWEQGWNFKSTLLIFESGTVLLNHTEQSILVHYFEKESNVFIPCANAVSRQERQYETMFAQCFFQPESREKNQARDTQIHALLLSEPD